MDKIHNSDLVLFLLDTTLQIVRVLKGLVLKY